MEKTISTVTIERSEYESISRENAELKVLVEYTSTSFWRRSGVYSAYPAKGSLNSPGRRTCPKCGDIMRDIGVATRRELKLIPAKVVMVEHVAHNYACRSCEKNNITVPFAKAHAPAPLISGSLASPSLVAHIVVQKYANGLPLYRLENGFAYDGVNISRQTMSNWVIACSERYLEPIYERMKTHLLEETNLHADETVVQVLRESGRDAKTKSYEWLCRTGAHTARKIAIYEYRETRSQEHPKAFLKDYQGLLHTDGYQAYHNLPPGITVIGCFAYVRLRFEQILKNMSAGMRSGFAAEKAMGYINALFSLEREFVGFSPEERRLKRLEKSKPVSDAFFAWLGVLPKSPLGEAVGYALSQKNYLENVYLDRRAEITNNRAERSVKPFVMGRKAWLFSNTPAGAKASSVLYSIIETAKENGLYPYHYVKFLLETLPGAKTSDLEALLPWNGYFPDECKLPMKQETVNAQKK